MGFSDESEKLIGIKTHGYRDDNYPDMEHSKLVRDIDFEYFCEVNDIYHRYDRCYKLHHGIKGKKFRFTRDITTYNAPEYSPIWYVPSRAMLFDALPKDKSFSEYKEKEKLLNLYQKVMLTMGREQSNLLCLMHRIIIDQLIEEIN